MGVQSLVHPTADTLAAFNCGALTATERAGVEEHISGCDSCCAALASLSEDRLVGLARKAGAQLPPTAGMIDIPDVPPELIDHPRYQVLSQLGAGGMGVVYKAEHRLMGRIVALKVVARRYTSNPAAVERFRREFRAAARLNHPNIVTAHDADEANGLHFLVMEYVEGISLDRLVRKKGPLPVATACQCIRQAALGLQHAFEQKMVHRDIKPHNLMVTRKGQVKVLDFGLARVAAETDLPALAAGTDHPDRTVTSASTVMGTPDYLAPEQARNSHDVDIRADIYALGCVFYFLLAGRAPFASLNTPLAKMLAHTQDEPESIRKLRTDVPADVLRVLERMMAKNPDKRFSTPGEVATEMKSFARAEAIVDEQPDIIDTATAPMFEVPTTPVARGETLVAPRISLKRKKAQGKRKKSRQPFWIAGITAGVLLCVGIGWATGIGRGRSDRPTEPAFVTQGGTKPSAARGSQQKRMLFVVPSEALFAADYFPVRERLEAGGVEVVTVSTQTERDCRFVWLGEANREQRPVKPDRAISEVNVSEYDGLIFCGADTAEFLRPENRETVRKLVNDMAGQRKLVTAICTGQRVLLELGMLRGKNVAIPNLTNAMKDSAFRSAGAKPVGPGVSVEGNLITASGPDKASEFADAILQKLK